MEGKLLLLISIAVSFPGLAQSLRCQIENIKIAATNTSATITWDISAECDELEIFKYEVLWEHVNYEACKEKTVKDPANIGSVEVPFPSRIAKTEANLHPYSSYEVFIKMTTGTYERINGSQSFRTEPGVPGRNPDFSGTAESQEQSLRFHWEDPSECEYINGRLDKYIVDLQGLDPWAEQTIDLQYNETFLGDFYAHNLKPFTSYLLRVHTRNTIGLVSREPLYIKAKTVDTTPLPPDQVKVEVISPSSVHLSWLPSYPPTGELEQFEVRSSESGILRSSVNVSLAHRCPRTDKSRRQAEYKETFCYVFSDLQPDYTFGFQVRVWNRGQPQPSDWSQTVNVTTSSVTINTESGETETEIPEVSPLVPPTTETTVVRPEEQGQEPEGYSDNTIIIILCLTFGLIFISVLVTALIYKLKIVRLKQQMRNEEMWNQGRDLHNLSHSASYIGGSSMNTQISNLSAYAISMNTSLQSEIQSRRLPEPPPLKNRADMENQYSEAYELDNLPAGNYAEMTPSQRNSRVLESTVIQEEESIDTDGYLRPTFPNIDLTPIKSRGREREEAEVDLSPEVIIAQESYVAPDLVRNVPSFPPETESNFNSLNFERLTGARLSENSQASSIRTSPSEPLIKSVTVSKPVDV